VDLPVDATKVSGNVETMTKHGKPSVPKGLSPESRRFWKEIIEQYHVTDAGGLALLLTCCQSLDHQRNAEAIVVRDGYTIPDRSGGIKPHPMLGVIRDNRQAFLTALRHLNLDLEPLRDIGGQIGGGRR
jgi:phage terminase small subunit